MHFIDEPIEVLFDTPPLLEKNPTCPNGFIWQEQQFRIVQLLSEWQDFQRRGRMARNMSPEHAGRAAGRGSWGVGRFFFRVAVEGGRVFEIYYDRAPLSIDERKGVWYLFSERTSQT